jgi:2-polyprenyl-3-methyl-5-hydroxy-6-metoxy-1,4-benzoquinol methylase
MQIYTWDKKGFEDGYWRYHYKLRGCGVGIPPWCKCNDTYITYSKLFFETNAMFDMRAENIKNTLQLSESDKVLVVGCALGFLMDGFQKLKIESHGFDNSNFINGLKNTEKIKRTIHNISILDNDFATKIRKATGVQEFDAIITEDVLPSHDTYDVIFNNCESVLKTGKSKSNIVHIVETNVNEPLIKKSLQEWKTVNSQHTWLNVLGEIN